MADNQRNALHRLRKRMALELRLAYDFDEPAPLPSKRKYAADDLVGMARVLDLLEAEKWSVSDAGRRMEISTAQMVKFLASDPALWGHVNQMRRKMGLRPLNS